MNLKFETNNKINQTGTLERTNMLNEVERTKCVYPGTTNLENVCIKSQWKFSKSNTDSS